MHDMLVDRENYDCCSLQWNEEIRQMHQMALSRIRSASMARRQVGFLRGNVSSVRSKCPTDKNRLTEFRDEYLL